MLRHTSLCPGLCCCSSPTGGKCKNIIFIERWLERNWILSWNCVEASDSSPSLVRLNSHCEWPSADECILLMETDPGSEQWCGVYCVGCFCRTWNSEPLVARFLFVSDSWLMLFISHSWSHGQSWLMTRFTCLQSDRRSDCSFFFCGGWPAAVMFHQKMGSPLSVPRVVWGLWWWFPLLFPEAELPLTLWQHSPPALGFLLLLCDRRQDAVRSLHFLKKIRLAGRRVNVYLRNMCSPVDLRPSSTLSHSPDSDSLKCASLLAQ